MRNPGIFKSPHFLIFKSGEKLGALFPMRLLKIKSGYAEAPVFACFGERIAVADPGAGPQEDALAGFQDNDLPFDLDLFATPDDHRDLSEFGRLGGLAPTGWGDHMRYRKSFVATGHPAIVLFDQFAVIRRDHKRGRLLEVSFHALKSMQTNK